MRRYIRNDAWVERYDLYETWQTVWHVADSLRRDLSFSGAI